MVKRKTLLGGIILLLYGTISMLLTRLTIEINCLLVIKVPYPWNIVNLIYGFFTPVAIIGPKFIHGRDIVAWAALAILVNAYPLLMILLGIFLILIYLRKVLIARKIK